MSKQAKIVVTGGPGGGKTTALDLFQRELVNQVATIPESATLLFSGGIKRSSEENILKATQKTIYQLQTNIEEIFSYQEPDKVLICDRGTLDGLAYWPGSQGSFFENIKSTYEQELSRYDAVIFFETAAKAGLDIKSNNPVRNESLKEAIEIDNKLQDIWSKHPNYNVIASSESFVKKIMFGIMTIENVVKQHT